MMFDINVGHRFLEHPGRFLEEMYGRGWADDAGSLTSPAAWSSPTSPREVGLWVRVQGLGFRVSFLGLYNLGLYKF